MEIIDYKIYVASNGSYYSQGIQIQLSYALHGGISFWVLKLLFSFDNGWDTLWAKRHIHNVKGILCYIFNLLTHNLQMQTFSAQIFSTQLRYA